MKNDFNERFLIDILHEVQRMDVITRNCLSLLQYLKPGLPYTHYISFFDKLIAIDDALHDAYEIFADAKIDLCDTRL